MEIVLETRDLRKTFTMGKVKVDALRGVNLSVAKGEFVAVMGPSGSGKSTLLHILGAMEKPTSGDVRIEGRDISHLNDRGLTEIRRQRIGFVFQKLNLIPTLTARANIEVARMIHRAPHTAVANRRLEELVSLLMIQDKMNHRPFELSGGEQQRVAIARAVIDSPAILLADEPTGNLDSENSEIILGMFKRLNDVYGQTTIIVTHDPDMAAYGSRLVRMRDGRIFSDSANPPCALVGAVDAMVGCA